MFDFDKSSECVIQYGFEHIVLEISDEKNKSLLAVIKKYKENLSIGNNIQNITVLLNNKMLDLNTTEISAGNLYSITIKHDKKG